MQRKHETIMNNLAKHWGDIRYVVPQPNYWGTCPLPVLAPMKIISGTIDGLYRATPMHSADYAVARCPSVRLSVHHTPVFYQHH